VILKEKLSVIMMWEFPKRFEEARFAQNYKNVCEH
jgi:hypothetical protein